MARVLTSPTSLLIHVQLHQKLRFIQSCVHFLEPTSGNVDQVLLKETKVLAAKFRPDQQSYGNIQFSS